MTYPDYLAQDSEVTGATNGTYGNPFTDGNRLVIVGYGTSDGVATCYLGDTTIPTSEILEPFRQKYSSDAISVGFNWKFDAHWYRRYGILSLFFK